MQSVNFTLTFLRFRLSCSRNRIYTSFDEIVEYAGVDLVVGFLLWLFEVEKTTNQEASDSQN